MCIFPPNFLNILNIIEDYALKKLCFPAKIVGLFFAVITLSNPVNSNAYEYSADEGHFVTRFKLGYAVVSSDEQEYVSGVAVNRSPPGAKLFNDSLSGEWETDYFLYDHFSLGGSIGFMPQKPQRWIHRITNLSDSGRVIAVPFAATAKFHIAPYGEIRPYITGGYHYTHFSSSFEGFKFEDSSGPLAGVGMDWWFSKEWALNLEAKQYFMETEVNRSNITLDNSITEVKINPLILSAGIVYRF